MKASDETVHIHFDVQTDISGIDLNRLSRLVHRICEKHAVQQADIEIQIADDDGISAVHERFLNSAAATDVISFDLTDDFQQQRCFQLVVNAEMAKRTSKTLGHPPEAELALYITHGMLHNLGFDDTDPGDAKKMHETEDALLQELGFGIIYHKQENID